MLKRLTMTAGALAAAVVLMIGTGAEAGSTLDTDTARRFVASLEPMMPMGKDLEAQGFMKDAKPADMISGGKFAPYEASLMRLQSQYPDVYQSVDRIARNHGFASAPHWAVTGDRVMLAYFLIKHPEMISMADSLEMPPMQDLPADMDPQMRAMIEARMQAMAEQMGPIKIMAESLKTVPEGDKAAVTPVVGLLDEQLNGGPFGPDTIKPGQWGK